MGHRVPAQFGPHERELGDVLEVPGERGLGRGW
jgi:hypothetical protein